MAYVLSKTSDDGFLDVEPDEYIFAVQYNENHVIQRVKVTFPTLIEEMTEAIANRKESIAIGGNNRMGYNVIDRAEVVRGLNAGKTYMTVTFDAEGNYEGPGALVTTQSVGKKTWIKTVPNANEDDNLGSLPEFASAPA